jgi:outer membrane protein, heavy metal efflux system
MVGNGTQRDAAVAEVDGESYPAEIHPGAGWRAWVVSILAAILLSAAVTLLLGGDFAFGSDGPAPKAPDTLQELVDDALARNPELQATRYMAEAKQERVSPAGSLPDPMLSLALSNVPVDDFSLSKADMTSRDIGFTQAFPFPGKLSLKEEVARLDAAQAGDRATGVRNAVRFRVRKAYYSLEENRDVARLTEKNKALLGELLEVANSRYAVGKAPQQDLFKAQVEISRMEKMLIALRKQEVSLLSELNTLRDRAVDTPVVTASDPGLPALAYTEDELVAMARRENPDLKREEDGIARGETALRLARKQILPDFQIGAAYKVRENTDTGMTRPDFFSASVGITLPLWHRTKQDQEVKAAARDLSAGRSGYSAAVNAVRNRIRDITADLASMKESLSLYDTGLLPQARESVSSSRSAYEVGQVEFASVLMGQLSLYQQEIEREKTAQSYRIRASELELVVGKELFSTKGQADGR